MKVKKTTEAKAHLSSLLQVVSEGEEIVLGRAGKPIARIVPYEKEYSPRTSGTLKGRSVTPANQPSSCRSSATTSPI